MTENTLLIAFCVLAVFLLGYVIGWIRGQQSMMPIIANYKEVVASYKKQLHNWRETVESIIGE